MGQFVSEMEEGLVVDVEIPERAGANGMLRITLRDNQQRNLYVSDVVEVQELVKSYNIEPIVGRAAGELVYHRAASAADAAGGRGVYVQHDECAERRQQRRQNDEFWQEQGAPHDRRGEVTPQGRGWPEGGERDLEEIVDFLKDTSQVHEGRGENP